MQPIPRPEYVVSVTIGSYHYVTVPGSFELNEDTLDFQFRDKYKGNLIKGKLSPRVTISECDPECQEFRTQQTEQRKQSIGGIDAVC